MAVFVSYCPLFGVLGDLHGPWHLVHVWEAWPKTPRFCVLGPFSWAIAHCFGFPRWFTRPVTLTKCLRCMTKNLSFLHFWAIFVSYSPQFMAVFVRYFPLFWGSGGFTWPVTLGTCLRGLTKNSPFLLFRVVFMSYCPLFWVSDVIYMAHDTH
jgi:hypothetical protein